jgi:hypothetical protein
MFKHLFASSLLLVAAPAMGAVVLVNDPFTDGGRTNGADAQDIAWWHTGAVGTFQVQTDPSTSSSALLRQPGSTFSRFVGFFNGTSGSPSAQSLALGDSITLSFDLRYTAVPSTSNNGLRFGLYNSNLTRQADDFAGNAGNNFNGRLGDAGYYAGLNFGAAGATNNAIFREADTDGSPLGGSEVIGLGSGFASAVIDTNVHNLALTVTRTATGVNVGYSFDNGTAITRSDTVQNTTAFDAIYIGHGNDSTAFYVDNVNVAFTAIPEPSSIAAIVGIAGLALRRRTHAC